MPTKLNYGKMSCLLFLLVLPLVTVADDELEKGGVGIIEKGEENDLQALEGEWKVVRAKAEGVNGMMMEGRVWSFKQGKLRVVTAGDPNDWDKEYTMNFDFKIDPAKSPKQLTMTLVDEANQKVVNHAIYELKGNSLKLCWTFNSLPQVKTPFPKEFKLVRGDKLTSVFEFERVTEKSD